MWKALLRSTHESNLRMNDATTFLNTANKTIVQAKCEWCGYLNIRDANKRVEFGWCSNCGKNMNLVISINYM